MKQYYLCVNEIPKILKEKFGVNLTPEMCSNIKRNKAYKDL